jgi:hypothetical protein
MKSASTGKPPTAQGIGESRVFADPNAAPDSKWLTATVNGVPVDPSIAHLLTWEMTDQGWAERNAGKEPRRVEIMRDGADNSRLARKDFIENGGEQQYAPDPLKDAVAPYVRSGFSPRLLSKARIDGERNTRGFDIVRDENGDPVRYKNMVFGEIPTDVAEARNKAVRAKSAEQMTQISDNARGAGLRDMDSSGSGRRGQSFSDEN